MLRSHKRMQEEIAALCDRWTKELEREAREVLRQCPSLTAFSAAMGSVSFYGKDGYPIDSAKVPKRARVFLDMVDDYEETFRSPGIQI